MLADYIKPTIRYFTTCGICYGSSSVTEMGCNRSERKRGQDVVATCGPPHDNKMFCELYLNNIVIQYFGLDFE